ncbi:18S rRNA (guanine1575-N7)-methyltransferase [Pancytospora epiphaga]|nr:18S rRNA (guanine1575-N7)-methyltransferase [Pancytospora epiphaga]
MSGPAELYYDKKESESYTRNTRNSKIQREMTQRAIELLRIDNPPITPILDLGCGSGLSGQVLSEKGYMWVGTDISPEMLNIAQKTTGASELLLHDLGTALPFRKGCFDYAISISAVQWLFQSYKSSHHPIQRIKVFFRSLYDTVGICAVIQFYCGKKEIEILKKEALNAGFKGGLTVDNEGKKSCKYFLVLDKYKRESCIFKETRSKLLKRRMKVE